MWAQYDFGDGPRIGGTATILFCLWLAWSRFRVVLPLLNKSQPSVLAAIDVALRRIGGCPTYLLTDNEKTVTAGHVAGIPVRNPGAVAFARHYRLTIATCLPADPATKGGSEATVRIAKADLVPTAANLLPGYASFAGLEAACAEFCGQVNGRPHRATRRVPAEMLAAVALIRQADAVRRVPGGVQHRQVAPAQFDFVAVAQTSGSRSSAGRTSWQGRNPPAAGAGWSPRSGSGRTARPGPGNGAGRPPAAR
jgi:hypothetical protein